MKEYIHYGHKYFDINKFDQIKNETLWVKPCGGLWASAVDSKYGWNKFNEDNRCKECDEQNSFKFTLKENSNVFHIYSVTDLSLLPRVELNKDLYAASKHTFFIDFENALYSGIDAIELHLSEEKDKHNGIMTGLYYLLYGWDCDSILIMNPEIVVPI